MNSYIFRTTRTVVNEAGATKRLGEIISELEVSRVMVVTDQGIVKAGLLDLACEGLKSSGLEVVIYANVVADPPEKIVLESVQLARERRVDCVVGLGGGSSMDVAKLTAFLATSSQSLSDIYGIELAKGPRLPLVLIPTTAGTGSEATQIAIVTTGESEKKGVVAPQLLPDIAVLDADLTFGVPSNVTAATAVDSMVHAIEAYTTKLKKNPISDALAREGLRLLTGNIHVVMKDGYNREARSNMLLGSFLAGQAFANAPVGAVHALAYPVGGHFHVPHGLSNSLLLPHVMRFNAPVVSQQYAELARIIFPEIGEGSDEILTGRLIDGLEKLILDVNLENRLSLVRIRKEHLPMLAEDAMKQQRLLLNNPRVMTYEDALEIYTQAF